MAAEGVNGGGGAPSVAEKGEEKEEASEKQLCRVVEPEQGHVQPANAGRGFC